MAGLKKVMITPWFGDLPEWMPKFEPPKGYGWLVDTDLNGFKQRVKDKLGIEYAGEYGSSKLSDYRSALGFLYKDEIKGYDYWGHTDFDCVFGDVDKFFQDSELSELDVWSNHHSYVCGCWTLYKNSKEVNELFLKGDWYENMVGQQTTGWVEESYSRTLEQSGLKYKYTFFQGNPWTNTPSLKKVDGKLYQQITYDDCQEIAFFHFRHSKKWPL